MRLCPKKKVWPEKLLQGQPSTAWVLIEFINQVLNPGGQQAPPTPSFIFPSFCMVSSKVIRGKKKSIFKWLVEKKYKEEYYFMTH